MLAIIYNFKKCNNNIGKKSQIRQNKLSICMLTFFKCTLKTDVAEGTSIAVVL
jgi:hypothetical protein